MREHVLRNAPNSGVRFERDTEIVRLIRIFTEVFARLDVDLGELKRNQYAETASGTELERIGREVGVKRPVGETDEKFRIRVLSGREQSISKTTWDDFAEVALDVLQCGEDEIEILIDYSQELGAVILEAESDVINESPFTESEIISFLEGTIPMSRRVVIQLTDIAVWDDAQQGWGTQWGSDITS